MIKQNLRKKNPSFYKYGYHITIPENLENISKYGLKQNVRSNNLFLSYNESKFKEELYGRNFPIWFYITDNFNKLSSWSKSYFYKYKYINKKELNLILLKVNIENFDQYPDIEPLLNEEYFDFDVYSHQQMYSNYLLKYINLKEPILLWNDIEEKNYKIPKKIKYYLKLFNNMIPISELKNNSKLILNLIDLTGTLCVIKNIPSKYIESYKYIDWVDLFGNKKYEWMD